ncbi:MAG TPA: 30S ribosomal protein S12 methylthiotransferase RimO [Longimicrobiales bacterium]|nr:30S ribosomal protein S12 methylthiotransferase RimO [Longimicrobiales bacterium]
MRSRDLPVFPLTAGPVRPDVAPTVQAVHHEPDAVGPADGPRIALVTLGCDKNTVDSERMMASLVGHGARVSGELDGADVVIVNTCGFIEAAKEQSIETILEACALKEEGGVRAVVAVGCMVQRYKDELRAEIPEVDVFMGLTELEGLIPELQGRELLPPPDRIPVMERPLRILSTATPHSSFLKISEGCDHTCAFCAIPLMRGLHRSQPLDALVAEARSLGEAGVRELNIISQDTTWWGRDLRRHDRSAPLLPDLLRALLAGAHVDWIRLFYMYPSGITPELVELVAESASAGAGPRIVPYLDLPLQHGSDRMLQAMRRPERRATIRERVGWLRDAIPELTLRTTVIVGFPGETEEDFEELVELLEEIRFDRVGAFAYSIEEGTRAAEMEGQLPASLKQERLEALLDVQRGISLDRNLELVGARRPLLVDQEVSDDPEFAGMGRTDGQAADVDGVTHLLALEGAKTGDLVEVEIVDAMEYDLIGKVVAT